MKASDELNLQAQHLIIEYLDNFQELYIKKWSLINRAAYHYFKDYLKTLKVQTSDYYLNIVKRRSIDAWKSGISQIIQLKYTSKGASNDDRFATVDEDCGI